MDPCIAPLLVQFTLGLLVLFGQSWKDHDRIVQAITVCLTLVPIAGGTVLFIMLIYFVRLAHFKENFNLLSMKMSRYTKHI
jgi:hypothetical protein